MNLILYDISYNMYSNYKLYRVYFAIFIYIYVSNIICIMYYLLLFAVKLSFQTSIVCTQIVYLMIILCNLYY